MYVTIKLSINCETSVLNVARIHILFSPVKYFIFLKINASAICPTRNAVSEPTMMFIPCPNIAENAACMSGTPTAEFELSQYDVSGEVCMAK